MQNLRSSYAKFTYHTSQISITVKDVPSLEGHYPRSWSIQIDAWKFYVLLWKFWNWISVGITRRATADFLTKYIFHEYRL